MAIHESQWLRLRLSTDGRREGLEAMVDRLLSALAAANDTSLIVLEGGANTFCNGLDVAQLEQWSENGALPTPDPLVRLERLLHDLATAAAPVIALVDGPALGGGLGLVCAADLVLATPRARFGLPETMLGVLPATVFPWLARRVGVPRARLLAIGAPPLDAQGALRAGLVDAVVDDLPAALRTNAARFARMHPLAVAATKRLVAQFHETPPGYVGESGSAFRALLVDPETRDRIGRWGSGLSPWREDDAVSQATQQQAELAGRVVIVTGGTRGIGRAIVLGAAARGAAVVFCARHVGGETNELVELASRFHGVAPLGVCADMRSEGDIRALFDAAVTRFGRVHAVVNNAAVSVAKLVVSLSSDQWDDVIATNLTGAFLLARRAIGEFVAQGTRGRIVSLGSLLSYGAPSNASYAAAKSGLEGLTHKMASDHAADGITANLVVAGYVETELTRDLPDAARRALVAACPARRPARADEVASAVLFFLSDRSAGITGQALRVSGGLVEVPDFV